LLYLSLNPKEINSFNYWGERKHLNFIWVGHKEVKGEIECRGKGCVKWVERPRTGSMTVIDQLSNYQIFTKDFL